ncbi:unnamed protein product [Tuber aestivum]|uniref:Guanine nucleotide-binding protein-like 3 N-terminal domain-containing protein n=1 Tax=Tuber aestivum TaxID=59557 RepID=A0A292PK87_9PEZI|nr:unnamed protein product [Tuber aestivum]
MAHRERKEAKKHPELRQEENMNDKLNIPSCFPYKIVHSEIEEGKLLKEQEQLRRELAKRRKEELVGRSEGREDAMQDHNAMDENDANSRVPQWQPSWPYGEQGPQNMKPSMVASAASPMIFKQVVDATGITLYVLDTRDPEGTRSRDVDRQIMGTDGSEKQLILILNKIYLVPGTPERVVGLSPQRLPNAATKR